MAVVATFVGCSLPLGNHSQAQATPPPPPPQNARSIVNCQLPSIVDHRIHCAVPTPGQTADRRAFAICV